MAARPARERRQVDRFAVTEARQTGFRECGAADQAARAARRGQRTEDGADAQPRAAAQAPVADGDGGKRRGSPEGAASAGGRRKRRRTAAETADDVASPPEQSRPEPASAPRTAAGQASSDTEPDANLIKLYMDQDEPGAPTFPVRLHGKRKHEELTPFARASLLIELAGARGSEERSAICAHYGVSDRQAKRLKQKWRQRASFESAARSGRQTIMGTPGHLAKMREINRDMRAAGVRRQSGASVSHPELQGGTIPGTNKRRAGVSPNTWWRWKKRVKYATRRTKWVPNVNDDAHAARREEFATRMQTVDFTHRADGDEKQFEPPLGGNLSVHPASDSESESLRRELYRKCRHKKYLRKVMALCFVSKPVLKQGWTDPADMWERDGKIGIWRVAEHQPQQNGKRMRDQDGKLMYHRVPGARAGTFKNGDVMYQPGFEPGWMRLVDVNMGGALYHDMIRDKVIPAMKKYFAYAPNAQVQRDGERSSRIVLQEDGAGGHGLGRSKGGTTEHQAMAQLCDIAGIDVEVQSGGTPELNGPDLGVWSAIDAGVNRRYREFIDWRPETIL